MVKAIKNIQKVPFSIETIIQGMPENAYIFSKEGKLLTWNKNLEITTGFSKDELKNKFISEFIYEPDKERVVKKFMEILAEADNNERTIEYSIRAKSGKIIPILALRSLVIIEGKEYIIGIAINLSNLKKEKLDAHINDIIHFKNQLQDYYRKIEKMNQAEIELKEKLFLNAKNFNSKLINNLPGIFYLYEKIGDKFFLKKWNKNYSTDLGYPDDEILNMQPHQFFTKKEFKKAEKAIIEIFTTGATRTEIYTTHKNGKQIPYSYQGYLFEDKGREYFMGVGIDISYRYALEEEQKQQQIEKHKLKEKSNENKRELIATALQISKTAKIIKHTLKHIDELLKKQEEIDPKTEICNNLVHIKKDLELQISQQNNWEVFKSRFKKVHKGFFNNLKKEHPSLSRSELKFCAYLRIHLSSSEIASALNVTYEAIKKTRYRIRKKLEMSPKDSLEDYIVKF